MTNGWNDWRDAAQSGGNRLGSSTGDQFVAGAIDELISVLKKGGEDTEKHATQMWRMTVAIGAMAFVLMIWTVVLLFKG